ncbi:MAG TPA: TonB-dependent receptor [Candidatus Acidoferrum sp.]
MLKFWRRNALLVLVTLLSGTGLAAAQSNAIVEGIVLDPSGSFVSGASVEIHNPVSRFSQKTETDANGKFRFTNIPFDRYHFDVKAKGFSDYSQELDVRSQVGASLEINLKVAAAAETVTVEASAGELLETSSSSHVDVGRELLDKMPTEGSSSGLSVAIEQSAPAVVADSNGSFHPLGEHADVSYSVDGQSITDQQSKTFANQLPVDAVQSMEAISGIAPAEFGDKTSLVVRVTTRSGLGVTKPTGSVTFDYGSFGTATADANVAFGGDKWGDFLAVNGLQSGRFLDSPEFFPIHDKGNAESVFDRFDWQANPRDTLHLNLGYTRSWFQIPNTFDQQLTAQDQRQFMRTFNFAPSWTRTISPSELLNVSAYVRQDRVSYYPSADPFDDQPATLQQSRRLTATGAHVDYSYAKGKHNAKAGIEYGYWALSEGFSFGVTSPTYNAVCLNPDGSPNSNPSPTNPALCATSGLTANPGFLSGLLPYDLTRGGVLFRFDGTQGINEAALYAQDEITLGNWSLSLGVRGDLYRGISTGEDLEPRTGAAYTIKKTHTVLRLGYGRFFETPYNENLILSSSTGAGGLGTGITGSFGQAAIQPGKRNEFTAGFQQALGKYLVVDAQYFWKYTHNAYDFDVLFNTPLAFPIQWRKSKIDGFGIRLTMPDWHGLTAYSVLGHTRARFFGPETGGIIFNSPVDVSVFRIDHDQVFQQTTHLQYQPWKRSPWVGLTWRYDSGQVAGAVPDYATALGFSGDDQAAIGLFCGNTFAAINAPIRSCAPGLSQGATRVVIPAPGTFNPDTHPARIASRNMLDLGVGMDDIFHGDRYKWSARLSVSNLTNEEALYNFLSTFSGTHFVPPRTFSGEIGMHF